MRKWKLFKIAEEVENIASISDYKGKIGTRIAVDDGTKVKPPIDGGGSSGGMTPWQQDIERRLGRIEDRVMVLPSRNDFLAYVVGGLSLGLAAMGILAGGLVGGLGWLETRVARVQPAAATPAPIQPIVIQMPGMSDAKPHRR